jgi:enoyl-CoA hydratase/carnithine racemase
MGLDERMGSDRALQIGLVSEITSRSELWPRAHYIAATIAAKPSVATQGTVRAVWDSMDLGRSAAMHQGLSYTQLGNPLGGEMALRQQPTRPEPTVR